jgi:RNA polymerase sigma-54 factor
MELFQSNLNKKEIKTSINQSLQLQHDLKILSLNYEDLNSYILETFENNLSIEWYESSHYQPSAESINLIPNPKMENHLEQIPTKLLSAEYKILAKEVFSRLSPEGFLQQEEKREIIEQFGPKVAYVIEIFQKESHLGYKNRQEYWKALLIEKNQMLFVDFLNLYSNELSEGDFSTILRKLNITYEDFKKTYLSVFRKLPWAPRDILHKTPSITYYDASIMMEEEDKELIIYDPMPHFSLSSSVFLDSDDVKQFYKKDLESIQLIVSGVKKRNSTLHKVLIKLMEEQKAYLLQETKTPKHIDPKDLACDLNIHPSTLARTIQNKQILCPRGIISLKSLVEPQTINENKLELLQKLKDIVACEDKKTPFSDEKLLQILRAKGSKISRRTVTKYRHELKIPDARSRLFC